MTSGALGGTVPPAARSRRALANDKLRPKIGAEMNRNEVELSRGRDRPTAYQESMMPGAISAPEQER